MEVCQTCNEPREVCCSYVPRDPELGYCYCRKCCPWQAEHVKDRLRIAAGYATPEPPTLAMRVVALEAAVADLRARYGLPF